MMMVTDFDVEVKTRLVRSGSYTLASTFFNYNNAHLKIGSGGYAHMY